QVVTLATTKIFCTRRKIELLHAARRPAVRTRERTDKPPPEPTIVRLRGHEPDLVVHRLVVHSVMKPEPWIVWIREIRLIAYRRVRTCPWIEPAPRAGGPGAGHQRFLPHKRGGRKVE